MEKSFYLLLFRGDHIESFPVTDFLTMGSGSENNVVLRDVEISERHARIQKRGEHFIIRDLQSQTGLWVNHTRVMEATLQEFDQIQIGPITLTFSPFAQPEKELKSRNEAWSRQLSRVPAFSLSQLPVLITGPSGSGKEVLSQWIHQNSRRRAGPFVTINCSALSESLIESELFGHIKGSFTGATIDRKGSFEEARSGTLFLDEIGDLPLSLQPKLLRAIENHEIRPVGSDKTVETDVRILAATHKNLEDLVKKGLFREDLYFRLNICRLSPPPLARRMEDFDDLLYSFCKKMRVRFSHMAILEMKKHSWPGNVRELKNAVARASAYFPGLLILPEHVSVLVDPLPLSSTHQLIAQKDSEDQMPLIKQLEKQMIVERLMINKGNQRRTAEDLGLPKSTLNDRIRTYNIQLDQLVANVR